VYVKLMVVGGVLLVVGLFAPWYFLVTSEGEYYSMNAFGGSLVDVFGGPEFFSSLAAYFSLIFAVVTLVVAFVVVMLPDKSRRKYVGVVSCLGAICALMSVVYLHVWLGEFSQYGSFFNFGSGESWGPSVGYFLTWGAVGLLFGATYLSEGLVQKPSVETT
jgi:hypothetical protein